MSTPVHRLYRAANRNAGWLLLGGLGVVSLHNWRLWTHDRAFAERLRTERPAAPGLSFAPKVSALVAAWNEAEHIDAHIRSFLALRKLEIELVICAGGADNTFERARQYAGPRVIVLEQRAGEGKQRALVRCLERATGEIIFLTDADCRFEGAALRHLLAPLVNEGEQAATGASRPLEEQQGRLLPGYLWAIDAAVAARQGRYSSGLLGRNAALTRQAIERSGGLDFHAPTGTDYQLARRLIDAGIPIRFVGASVVPAEYPESLATYANKQSRWLRNLLLYGPRYGATADVRATAQTVALGAAMTVSPLAALFLGPFALVLWAVLVSHAALAKLRYASFTARLHGGRLPRGLLLGLLPLTIAEFAIWALPIRDMLDRRRRSQW